MASITAIHTLVSGLAQHLSRAYQLRPLPGLSCSFEPLGISAMKLLDGQATKCTILLYRTSHNEHLRNRPPASLPFGKAVPLTVNLHLLVTIWADSALKEQNLLAWTMRELHQRPVVERNLLGDSTVFDADDLISLSPEELSLDDMTKLWQVLTPPYRPSLTYVARNVRIDLDSEPDHAPVVATRLSMSDDVASVAGGAV
jgi:hypothetical protein